MERLDKIISNRTTYSRKEAKALILSGQVFVNDINCKDPERKCSDEDSVRVKDSLISDEKYIVIMMNKPKGVVSSSRDPKEKTVVDLVPTEFKRKELFPAGRLDKDTTGMLIITDNGALAHDILSPRHHVLKKYEVTLDIPITDQMISDFESSVVLSDGPCAPAGLEILSEYQGIVTLREGRYHQIKRMFGCYGGTVLELHRLSMGGLSLDESLSPGECRLLSQEEIILLQQRQ